MASGSATSTTVLKGGTLVDATESRRADVVVSDGVVVGIGDDLSGDVVLDAGGCVVAPGLVDLHAHLRQPGKEEAEKRAGDITDSLGFLKTALLVFAGVAVLVGGFLIFNTFAVTVAQRSREFALLRAVALTMARAA